MPAIARAIALAILVAAVLASPLPAQEHHPAGVHDSLGTVHFVTSCHPAVTSRMDRAVALLHSFEFGAAIRAFQSVLASDSTCAMAWWGIALAYWTNPMSPAARPAPLLAKGRQASDAGSRLARAATERERGYIGAVAKLYGDPEHVSQQARVDAYARAMADLVARQPADTEAKIFYAISLVAAAPPTDKTYADQRRAGAILEPLWAAQPDHPGLAHYIIHAYDVPALAPRARAAALRYADIAPGAPHALHMPSHTFTRLGMWEESIRANERSAAAALRDSSIAEVLHASDYLVYAYLQLRRDSAARAVVDALPALAARFDPGAVTGAAPGSAGVFALAAIPARYALERRAWTEAASLVPTRSPFPYADAMTYFVRALGSAHLKRRAAARRDIDTLAAIHRRLAQSGESYWAEQVAISRLGALAWLELAEGHRADALAHMREAARREDATEKSAVSPGPLAPARELLGDMLLELHRPREALVEYRRTLAREPRRWRALDGARRAASAAGDRATAESFAAELRSLNGGAVPAPSRPR
ncbi:MAG TPA: hypothetical protein VFS44_00880 [Gemmatimonadaceae bacterium]|nr:hypothetical protein [Gemmatimonadaceae bacterium]